MFLDDSRYAGLPTDTVLDAEGRPVEVVRLRPLDTRSGRSHQVRDRDRLDLLAHEKLGDGRAFWRIADANSALDARALVEDVGDTVQIPEDG